MAWILTALTPALAQSYTAEIAIPSVPLPGLNPGTEVVISRSLANTDHADVEMQSTHPNLVCLIEDGEVVVEFRGTTTSWPAQPFSGVCASEGYTLTATAVSMSPETDWSLQSWAIVNDTVTFTKIVGSSQWHAYKLPSGTYTAGTYNGTLPGLKCVVETWTTQPGWFVSVRHGKSAALGTGTCKIPRPGSSVYTLTVNAGAAEI